MNRREQAAWDTVVEASKNGPRDLPVYLSREFALTLIDMMAQPVMPPEPTPEMLEAMVWAHRNNPGGLRSSVMPHIYRVIYEELRRPKAPVVEWTITGYAQESIPPVAAATARTEAELNSVVTEMWRRPNVEAVTIRKREVRP